MRQSALMVFEGRSTSRGRIPRWLLRVADVRFCDISGDHDTVLHFEAPTLGEAAEEVFRQQTLWPMMPAEDDTAFDLLADAVTDLVGGNLDSERLDTGLLRRFARTSGILSHGFERLAVAGHRYAGGRSAAIDKAAARRARELCTTTPSPQRTRVAGKLDMIRQSTSAFAVRLDDATEVRGVLRDDDAAQLTSLFGSRVLVLGDAVFRASGRLLRIDADSVTPGDPEPGIWSKAPVARARKLDVSALRRTQGPRSGVSAIVGQWPGDETDEQVRDALDRLS